MSRLVIAHAPDLVASVVHHAARADAAEAALADLRTNLTDLQTRLLSGLVTRLTEAVDAMDDERADAPAPSCARSGRDGGR